MSEEKVLYIVRHGKSSWDYEDVSDVDRPLKNRGLRNSYEMPGRLKKDIIGPGLIITSPAIRALHTAVIFARVLDFPYNKIVIEERIYESSENEIINFIKKTNDAISSIMVFGHNPCFTYLANKFVKNRIDNIPTAGVVILKFDSLSWKRIEKSNLKSEHYIYPKKT